MKDLELLNEVRRTLRLEGEAILAAEAALSDANSPAARGWTQALDLMRKSLEKGGKIVVTGVGKSGKIANKIAASLSSTGSQATFLHPTEGLHGDLGFVSPNDVILALSYTGNTEELIRILPAFQALKTPVISITGKAKSRLAEQSDAVIDASVVAEACPNNLAPTTSSTLALAIGDAFVVALMKARKFDAEGFARNHPGGSLGRRLHLDVKSCMLKGSEIGTVTEETTMDQVVVVATKKRTGAVLVTRNEKLIGLITDGDIRKSLTHREKFFDFRASEIMTKNPITVSPETPARDALALMENRESQISVLPVVSSDGTLLGLLRLHDLLQTF